MAEVLVGRRPSPELRQRVLTGRLNAPELFYLELLDILRKLLLRSKVTEEQADRVVRWLRDAPIAQARHRPLVSRAWELRHDIRSYDGAYVALAEDLNVPLVTADAKLGRSTGHTAKIEVYPVSD